MASSVENKSMDTDLTVEELMQISERQKDILLNQGQQIAEKENQLSSLQLEHEEKKENLNSSTTLKDLRHTVDEQEQVLKYFRGLRTQAKHTEETNKNSESEMFVMTSVHDAKQRELGACLERLDGLTRQLKEMDQGRKNGLANQMHSLSDLDVSQFGVMQRNSHNATNTNAIGVRLQTQADRLESLLSEASRLSLRIDELRWTHSRNTGASQSGSLPGYTTLRQPFVRDGQATGNPMLHPNRARHSDRPRSGKSLRENLLSQSIPYSPNSPRGLFVHRAESDSSRPLHVQQNHNSLPLQGPPPMQQNRNSLPLHGPPQPAVMRTPTLPSRSTNPHRTSSPQLSVGYASPRTPMRPIPDRVPSPQLGSRSSPMRTANPPDIRVSSPQPTDNRGMAPHYSRGTPPPQLPPRSRAPVPVNGESVAYFLQREAQDLQYGGGTTSGPGRPGHLLLDPNNAPASVQGPSSPSSSASSPAQSGPSNQPRALSLTNSPVLRRALGGRTPPRYASRSVINSTYMRQMSSETLAKYKRNASEIYRSQLSRVKAADTSKPTNDSTQSPDISVDLDLAESSRDSPVVLLNPVLGSGGVDKPVPPRPGLSPRELQRRHSRDEFDLPLHQIGPPAVTVEMESDSLSSLEAEPPSPRAVLLPSSAAPLRSCLKGQREVRNKISVSFHPLALLLDASLEGDFELVKQTANKISNLSVANDEGITALHNAICAGHFAISEFLVKRGADVNAADVDGWTPLHCAASCASLDMCRLLVENGAALYTRTLSDGETALEKCDSEAIDNTEVEEYLFNQESRLGSVNGGRVFGVFSLTPQRDDELAMERGDPLIVLDKNCPDEPDWWWCKNRTGRTGFVTKNFLTVYPTVQPWTGKENPGSPRHSPALEDLVVNSKNSKRESPTILPHAEFADGSVMTAM